MFEPLDLAPHLILLAFGDVPVAFDFDCSRNGL